ncbi:sugar-binding domain-containing protein [Sphingomonas sp. Ant20]|uniref:sugar-binding domain-containing protein n=1 Tax=Sphingomonas sp. Ant20 TaxID=104605 RepID=UPI000A6BEC85|nr:sugar-binding domain-containing protein [Sphingomonas sp. Ant20]
MTFTPPAMDAGQRAWLQFDAASRTAEVWLNGQRIGGHKGGFSRFRLDATRAFRAGQANTLLVKVDNTQPAQGSSTADILPLAGDFFVHGGLYRPVSLIVTNAVHVDMLDAGGSGIFATTRSIDAAMAKVDVRVRIRNDGTKAQAVNAVVRLIDAGGKTVATATRRIPLRADTASESVQSLSVATPHLWNGVADPYLHRLVVEIATRRARCSTGSSRRSASARCAPTRPAASCSTASRCGSRASAITRIARARAGRPRLRISSRISRSCAKWA